MASSPISRRIALIIWGGVYLVLFLWMYSHYIVPHFAFQHFAYRPDSLRTAWIAVWVLLPIFWLPARITRPSELAIWVLYLLVYMPAVVVSFHVLRLTFPFPAFFVLLFLAFLFLSLVPLLPPVRLPQVALSPRWFTFGLVGFWLVGYVLLFKAFGIRSLPSLKEIYQVRLAARSTVATHGIVIGYLLRWMVNVVNPFLLVLGLRRRHWILVGMAIVGQVLIFTFDATKSTLMSIPYLLGLYAALAWTGSRLPSVWFPQVSAAIFLVGAWLDKVLHTNIVHMYLIRRVFFVPGLLTALYYDYFSFHPKWHWAHTMLGRIFGLLPPTGTTASAPGFLIGSVYFHNPSGNANVNLWADAYSNLGIEGVILITLLLFLTLWLYDSVSVPHHPAMGFMLMAMPLFALTNSSFLTALLTHGWAPAILLLWLWPASRDCPEKDVQNTSPTVPADNAFPSKCTDAYLGQGNQP